MHRQISQLLLSAFVVTVLASTGLGIAPVAAATIATTTTCSNGVDETPGLGLICEVTIVNTITGSGGTASVTVRECHGPAGDPEAACSTTTDTLSSPVTTVTQCNGSTNGGGGTLRCSVDIINHFIGVTPGESAVTVDQCDGSGDGIANTCDPFPSTTSGATVTQCNGSANGGGLVELTCTATGTEASAHPLTINQCNGSTNGGGALVICSTSIANSFAAAPTPAPASGSGGSGGSTGVTAPPTDTYSGVAPTANPANPLVLVGLLSLVALSAVAASRRQSAANKAPRK
jgi:hypothetical protein